MASLRHERLAQQLVRVPALFGAIALGGWAHTGSNTLMGQTELLLEALQRQLPQTEDALAEFKLLLSWFVQVAKGQERRRLLKGLSHVVSAYK